MSAIDDLSKAKAENVRLRVFAKRLSDALLTVAPLGGSECFTRFDDDYYADPEWFKVRIRENRDRLHNAMKEAVMRKRADPAQGDK